MKTTTGVTKEEAKALAEKANQVAGITAEIVLNRGGKSFSVLLKNIKRGLSIKVGNESQMGMLLLAWGVLNEE